MNYDRGRLALNMGQAAGLSEFMRKMRKMKKLLGRSDLHKKMSRRNRCAFTVLNSNDGGVSWWHG